MKKFLKIAGLALMIGIAGITAHRTYGDVFELKLYDIYYGDDVVLDKFKVRNPSAFEAFIKANKNTLLDNAYNPWADPKSQDWQMLGYAVFFPENNNNTPQQVYVAKKRKFNQGNSIANNNPDNGGHVLNYSSNMHTERQLAIVALEEALGCKLKTADNNLKNYNQDRLEELLEGAKVPLNLDELSDLKERCKNLKGTLCIYTEYSPCKARKNENGELGCVEYYQFIASIFENINFKIFFKETDNFFDGNYIWPAETIVSIVNTLKKNIEIQNFSKVKGFSKVLFGNRLNEPLDLDDLKKTKTQENFNLLYNIKQLKNLTFYNINEQ